MASLKLRGLQSSLQKRDALHPSPASLIIPSGRSIILTGPSGCGKTLLLRAIVDLDPNQGSASLGTLTREDHPASLWRHQVGYLPAESGWWFETAAPHFDSPPEQYLDALRLSPDTLNKSISTLSSGERQRLALIRLLANQPQALLLDEPTAFLDFEATIQVEILVEEYQQRHDTPVLWVTHDQNQQARLGGELITMGEEGLSGVPV